VTPLVPTAVLAEFETPEQLIQAYREARDRKFGRLESFTPWPMRELDHLAGYPETRTTVARNTLFGGLFGAIAAYVIQWWTSAVNYPLDVGGRPAHAGPAFILITFETMVLCAGLTAAFTVFGLARLPQPWHPVFQVPGFRRASIDRYWLCITPSGVEPLDVEALRDELMRMGALAVETVAWEE
jgi:hypothetical protein